VRALLDGRSGVLITRQESAIVPIPFDEIMDPETGRTRVRMVDTGTASHGSARALQVRIEGPDLEAGANRARLAEVLGLDEEATRARYAPLVDG
jgi:6-phosphofructokinase 1